MHMLSFLVLWVRGLLYKEPNFTPLPPKKVEFFFCIKFFCLSMFWNVLWTGPSHLCHSGCFREAEKRQNTGNLRKTTQSFLLQLRADLHFFQGSEFINCKAPAGRGRAVQNDAGLCLLSFVFPSTISIRLLVAQTIICPFNANFLLGAGCLPPPLHRFILWLRDVSYCKYWCIWRWRW